MMAALNLNKVILGGRLTAVPELKQTPQGTTVCTFSIAVKRSFSKDVTDFINCVAWNKAAETVANHFGKGSSICVVGNIQTRSWKDKDGFNRYATEVVVGEVDFVDSLSQSKAAAGDRETYGIGLGNAEFEAVDGGDDLPF